MKYDNILFDEDGEVKTIELSEATTQELQETGYAIVNRPNPTKETYFVIDLADGVVVTKTINFKEIILNVED